MTTKLKIYVILGALVLLVACQSLDEGSSDKNEDPTQPSVIEFDQISDENDLDQRDIRFVENCLPVKENILSNFLTTGTLLFNRQTSSDYNELWSISRHSDEPKLLPSIATATLSPQGNWLASYNWRDGNVLQIIGSDQVISIEHQWETQWQNGYGLRWLDENWLVIPSASSSPEKLTLYNPFLDQEKFVTTELPNIYVLQPSYQLDGFVLFNKQLSHVLYVATTREDGQMLILLDSEQNQELWHFASPNVRNFPVAWNADGNHLAVAGELESSENLDKFEVFLIDVHGKVKQITQFAEYYSHTSINTLSWSPDGKYIAFWAKHPQVFEDVTPYTLHLINISTLEVINTCVPGGVGGPLAWSPDSQQLAFQSGGWMELNTLMILDLSSFQIGQILDESVSLVGWANWNNEAN